MVERDLIVGLIAASVGIVLVYNSFRNSTDEPRLGSMRFLQNRFGLVGAKRIVFAIGCLLIAIGTALTVTSAPKQFSGSLDINNNEELKSIQNCLL